MTDYLWTGLSTDILVHISGEFSTTVKASLDVTTVDNAPRSITNEGTNAIWTGTGGDKLYQQSGRFTTTIKTSLDVTAGTAKNNGIDYDGTGIVATYVDLTAAPDVDKLALFSGIFSTTIKTSQTITVPTSGDQLRDVAFDGTDTLFSRLNAAPQTPADLLLLASGKFTSTIKSSLEVTSDGGGGNVYGITNTGDNTTWIMDGATDSIRLQSGRFTSTLKDSMDLHLVSDPNDFAPAGCTAFGGAPNVPGFGAADCLTAVL